MRRQAGKHLDTHPPGCPPPMACRCIAASVSGGILDIISTACFIMSGLLCKPQLQSAWSGQKTSAGATDDCQQAAAGQQRAPSLHTACY